METLNYNEKVQQAQKELDNLIQQYYNRNEDGGNSDELYKIAFKVSKSYNVRLDDLSI